MDKYHPGYFGKVGMRYFHKTQNKFHCPTINVEKLWTLVSAEVRCCPAATRPGRAAQARSRAWDTLVDGAAAAGTRGCKEWLRS